MSTIRQMRAPGALAVDAVVALSFLFLLLPLIVIVPMSFSSSLTLEFPPRSWSVTHYMTFLSSSAWWRATRNTFQIGALAALLATAATLPAAYALTQTRIRGKALVRMLVMLPLITPLIVVAVATYSTFAPRGLSDSVLGLALVHGALGVPLAFLAVNASFEQLDPRQIQAARSLGATPLSAFFRVVVPAIRPGLVTGALFAFVYSFNEVVVAIFLGGRQSETLPKRMWDGILLQVDPVISAVASLMMAVTLLVLIVVMLARFSARRKKSAQDA